MRVPLNYIIRNLWARKLTTALTAAGMAMVVFVFSTVLMLDEGLKKTMVTTGSYDNIVVIRRSSETEIQSGIDREQASIIETQPEVALGGDGQRMVSKETVVLIALAKKDTTKSSNVIIRGMSQTGLALRPQVKIVQGRMFRAGSSEIVTGQAIAGRFKGVALGEKLPFGLRDWTVVGIFDAGKTGFDSEIWGDVDQLMQAFRRPVYSSVIFRLNDAEKFNVLKTRIETDPRLTIEAKREHQFYAEQSEMLSTFIRILGLVLSIIFSIGAIIGAMITMYASVASRTAEIGTLRALGFQRNSILSAFMLESLLLGFIGGAVGLLAASFMQYFTISTMNFQSFAELAFTFTLTASIVIWTLVFALLMGFVGGFLPAFRAARMNIVDALRAI